MHCSPLNVASGILGSIIHLCSKRTLTQDIVRSKRFLLAVFCCNPKKYTINSREKEQRLDKVERVHLITRTVFDEDKETARKILNNLKDVRVTDYNYPGVKPEKKRVPNDLCQQAARDLNAINMKESEKGLKYPQRKEAVIELGNKILNRKTNKRAGVCDQCAAAVIASIFKEKKWSSHLELINTGAHAFVIARRKIGSDLKDTKTWGEAFIIDLWWENLFDEKVVEPSDIQAHLDSGIWKLQVKASWTPEEIRGKNKNL